jgi:hypothetical protein
MRKDFGHGNGNSPNVSNTSLHKSHSWANLKDRDDKTSPLNGRKFKFDNNLTVHVSSIFIKKKV